MENLSFNPFSFSSSLSLFMFNGSLHVNFPQFFLCFFSDMHYPLFTLYILPFSQFFCNAFYLILFIFVFSDKRCYAQHPTKLCDSVLSPPTATQISSPCIKNAQQMTQTMSDPCTRNSPNPIYPRLPFPRHNPTPFGTVRVTSSVSDLPLTAEWTLMQTLLQHGSNHCNQR